MRSTTETPGTPMTSCNMSAARLLVAHAVISALVLGSLYDIVVRQEHWPFSNYPMFAAIHRESVLTWPRIYGVTAAGEEVPILSYQQLWPLDQSRLPIGLRAIYRREGAGERIHNALLDVLRRYESRRVGHAHDGPALVAMRLYLVSWPIEAWAENLDHPSGRQLLADTSSDR